MGRIKSKDYKCSNCAAEFGCRQHLYRHSLKCVKEISYSCNSCSKIFNRKDNLNRHVKVCKGGKPDLVCSNCNLTFSSLHNMNRHVENYCGKSKEKSCSNCGKVYKHQRYFEQHSKECLRKKSSQQIKIRLAKKNKPPSNLATVDVPSEIEEQTNKSMMMEYLVNEGKLKRFNPCTPVFGVS